MSLTKEQLAMRKSGIGGSDVAAILGISPWKDALEVYQDKVSDITFIDDGNDAMYFGSLHEPMILSEFQRRNPSLETYGCNKTFRHEAESWILYSPDGYVIENGKKGIFEAKTARNDSAWENGIPDYYVTQLRWYMMSEGLEFAWLAVLIGGSEWREYRIERDVVKENEMFLACKKFWEKHVAVKSPRGLTDKSTFGDLTIIFPKPSKEDMVTVTDDMTLGMLKTITANNEKRKSLDEENDKLKAMIVKITGGAGRLADVNGKTLANYIHVQPKLSVSVKQIMVEQPQLAALYPLQRKPYRTFRVYAQKGA
ncbi:MAG: YqaJ viral recombinase family protein [Desulfuromusa sp.]|nr:YqaJ viral recombinase family protein [Desulfuromusa sp.]